MKRNFLKLLGAGLVVCLLVFELMLPTFPSTPRAYALGNPCALDPANMIVNGSMAAASPDNRVAANWNSFVLSPAPAPTFEHVFTEDIDSNGSQYIWEDTDFFDA